MVFPTLRVLPVAGLAALMVLGGCGADEPSGASGSPSASSPAPSGDTTSPSAGDSPSSPPATSPAAPASLAGRLLTATELPGLTTQTGWTQGATGPANAAPFGACQEFDLATIGATKVLARAFSADGGATAAEQLAVFPDAMTAVRASRVIEAWRDTCQKRVHTVGKNLRVGKLEAVPVTAGRGSWYLSSWQLADDSGTGHFQAVGLAVNRSRIALVTMDNDGQDHDYAPGTEPMIGAVKAAAAKLG